MTICVALTPILQVEERNYLVDKEKSRGRALIEKVLISLVLISCEKRMVKLIANCRVQLSCQFLLISEHITGSVAVFMFVKKPHS